MKGKGAAVRVDLLSRQLIRGCIVYLSSALILHLPKVRFFGFSISTQFPYRSSSPSITSCIMRSLSLSVMVKQPCFVYFQLFADLFLCSINYEIINTTSAIDGLTTVAAAGLLPKDREINSIRYSQKVENLKKVLCWSVYSLYNSLLNSVSFPRAGPICFCFLFFSCFRL